MKDAILSILFGMSICWNIFMFCVTLYMVCISIREKPRSLKDIAGFSIINLFCATGLIFDGLVIFG